MVGDLFEAILEALADLFGAAGEMAGDAAGEAAGALAHGAGWLGDALSADGDLLAIMLYSDLAQRRALDAPLHRAGLRPGAETSGQNPPATGKPGSRPGPDSDPDPERVPGPERTRILAAMQGRLAERLPRFGALPQERGAAAHDNLLLATLRKDPAAGWRDAIDDLDTHALVERIEQPYPKGSEDHKAFLFGFLRANRDAAEYLRERVAGDVNRPASAGQ